MSVLSYSGVVSPDRGELLSVLRALHVRRPYRRRVYDDPSVFQASTWIVEVSIRSVLADAGLETLDALLAERTAGA